MRCDESRLWVRTVLLLRIETGLVWDDFSLNLVDGEMIKLEVRTYWCTDGGSVEERKLMAHDVGRRRLKGKKLVTALPQ